MKSSSFLCLLILLNIIYSVAQVSPKRGMAYGYHSVADINTVSDGVSWWYNWSSNPDGAIAIYYESTGVEFVPMVWGGSFDVNTVIANIKPDAKYLLAFNEPNFNVESNLTPQQAVNLWPQIEQIAAAKNLQIVSAAAAYCGGSVCVPGYTSPITWHDEFFALCPTCKVDFIAFHTYEPTVGGAKALTDNLKKYGRPIWVTEFATWDPSEPPADKINYLQQLVQLYENDPDIYRYAWFTGRSDTNPAVNLLDTDGELTALGDVYIYAAYGPQTTVPGKVEAESHYRRRGTDLETTTDIGGGQNVGWTDAGTWNEYILDVTTSGSYTFNFRIASAVNTGRFNILVDDQVVKSDITVNSTGDWQTWTDLAVNGIVLTAGEHLVRLEYTETGTNLNYFYVSYEGNVVTDADFSASPLATCLGNTVIFTDQTTDITGGETYNWDFGTGAIPATATGAGPHSVTYHSYGYKNVSLTVTNSAGTDTETKNNYIHVASPPTNCLFTDDFENNLVDWITPVPGAFTHNESAGNWTVSNGGYGEWENFNYELSNGTIESPLNFSCSDNKPILHIRARASANALLRVTLADGNGRVIDNISSYDLELTNNFATFSIDFGGKFRNYYGAAPGIVDSSNITNLQFSINPGYFSFPVTGVNGTYNSYFPGTVDIDWIGIGADCNAPTLPVELINFSAEVTDNTCTLFWSTASEQNHDHFLVEKSTDGFLFEEIGIVNGNGSSSSQINYSFEDITALSGITYYRLKLVDTNGSFSYSTIISVSPDVLTNLLWITPNPANGNDFSIHWTGPQECTIHIYNTLGELIHSEILGGNKKSMDASAFSVQLQGGVYVIKAEGSGVLRKLIIH